MSLPPPDELRLMERDRPWPAEAMALRPSPGEPAELFRRVEPQAKAVFEAIAGMRDEAIRFLQSLVRTRSANPSEDFEGPLADLVAGKMSDLGMEVRQIEPVPKRKSNWALHKGTESGRTLLFNTHLDTVPEGALEEWTVPPYEARIVGDRMIGRGTKDCKLGMASSLMALQAIGRAGIILRGDYMVTTTCDEETGGHLGICQVIDRGWVKADYCIYGEGYPDRLTIGARGWCQLELAARGRTAHTSRKETGINAIVQLCRVAPQLEALEFSGWRPHPLYPGAPVSSLNLIQGGFKDNAVPDRCTALLDMRLLPGMTAETILADVERVLAPERAKDPGFNVQVKPLLLGRPAFISPEEPFVGLMAAAVEQVTGVRPKAEAMGAASDSRWIIHDAGIPTVNFSMGNTSTHQPNEYIILDHYIQTIQVYALVALALLA